MTDSTTYLILACVLVCLLVITITPRHVCLPNGVSVLARDVSSVTHSRKRHCGKWEVHYTVKLKDKTSITSVCGTRPFALFMISLIFKSCLP